MSATQHTLYTAIGPTGNELWSTNGTTQSLLATGLVSAAPVVMDGVAYFATWQGVYKTDGTQAGTVAVSPVQGASDLVAMGGSLYFTAIPPYVPPEDGNPVPGDYSTQLFQLSAGGTVRQVTTSAMTPPMDGSNGYMITGVTNADGLVVAGNHLYFSAMTPYSGQAIHHWDGGTGMVLSNHSGNWNSAYDFLGSTLHPTADGSVYMPGWSGTLTVITPTGVGSVMGDSMMGGYIDATTGVTAGLSFYFVANAWDPMWGTMSQDVFVVQPGSFVATRVALPIPPTDPWGSPPPYSMVSNLTSAGDTAFYVRTTGGDYPQLYRTMLVGEQQVTGGATGVHWHWNSPTAVADGMLYFFAADDSDGHIVLSRSSGAGFAALANIPEPSAGGAYPVHPLQVATVGSTIYVTLGQQDGVHLFRIDGPNAAPVSISPAFQEVRDLHVVNGKLVFNANDGTHGAELWTSDGTLAGTQLAADLYEGSQGSNPMHFIALGPVGPDGSAPFVAPAQQIEYAENQGAGAVLGTVQASDNVGVTGFRFSDSQGGTSANGLFAIAANGDITLTAAGRSSAANDYEAFGSPFSVSVQAADAAGNWSAATQVSLVVTNVDDQVPVASTAGFYVYPEHSKAGRTAGQVQATDDVAVTGWRFADSQQAISGDGLFRVDAQGNVVLTAAGEASAHSNDYETGPGALAYQLQAGDDAGNWSNPVTLQLRVLDAADPPEPPPGTSPRALYTVTNSRGMVELWASDGSHQVRLHDSVSRAPQEIDGVVWFSGYDGVWQTDGTVQGTHQVSTVVSTRPLVPDGQGGVYLVGYVPFGGGGQQAFHVAGGVTTQVTPSLAPVPDWPNPYSAPPMRGFENVMDVAVANGKVYVIGWYLRSDQPVGTSSTAVYELNGSMEPRELTFASVGNARVTNFLPSGDPSTLYLGGFDPAQPLEYPYPNGDILAIDSTGGAHNVFFGWEGIQAWKVVGDDTYALTASGHLYRLATWGSLDVEFPNSDPNGGMPAQILPDSLVAFDDTLYYLVNKPGDMGFTMELHRTSGDFATTVDVGSIGTPDGLGVANGKLYVVAADPADGTRRLYQFDPYEYGAEWIADLPQGTFAGTKLEIAPDGDRLFMTLFDGTGATAYALEMGSATWTRLAAGTGTQDAGGLTVVGDTLLFSGTDPAHGTELWASDGTTGGTHLVKDYATGTNRSSDLRFNSLVSGGSDGGLVFGSYREDEGGHLFRSVDASGQQQVIALPDGLSFHFAMGQSGGTAYVAAVDTSGTTRVVKVDATGATVVPGPAFTSFGTVVDGKFFFNIYTEQGPQLMFADEGGVSEARDAQGRILYGTVQAEAGRVFLAEVEGSTTVGLYRWAGDQAVHVGDVPGITSADFFSGFRAIETAEGGVVQFSTSSGAHLYQFTSSGVAQVAGAVTLTDLQAVDDVVYGRTFDSKLFMVRDGQATQLTQASGPDAVTVRDIVAVGDDLLFTGSQGLDKYLFKLTEDGYTKVIAAKLPASAWGPTELIAAGGVIYYASGVQLYALLPGATGFTEVRGADGRAPYEASFAMVSGGVLYFLADDHGVDGMELWRTDGTAAGTFRVTDTRTALDSSPSNFITVDAPSKPGDEVAPVVASGQAFSYFENHNGAAPVAQVAATDDVAVTGFRFAETRMSTSWDGYFTIDAQGAIRLTAAGLAGPANHASSGTGQFNYFVQARDAAGSWSDAQTVALQLAASTSTDTIPPVISTGQIFPHVETLPAGYIFATVSASDNEGVTGFRFADSQAATSADGLLFIDAAGGVSFTPAGAASALNNFEAGAIIATVAVQARDAAGNWSAAVVVTLETTDLDEPATGGPRIVGDAVQGATLTVVDDRADQDDTFTTSYRWFRDGMEVLAASGSTSYVLGQADVGASITVAGIYETAGEAPVSVISTSTALIANVNDAPEGTVTITGVARSGHVLVAQHTLSDVDGMGPVDFQWYRDGVAVAGAMGTTYTLGAADVGTSVTVVASYVDAGSTYEQVVSAGTAPVQDVTTGNQAPEGEVIISGLPQQGEVLTVTHTLQDGDGLGAVGFQWLRNGQAIDGATGSTYELTQEDVHAAISVAASYTDGGGNFEQVTSAPTELVQNVDDPVTGSLAIVGAAEQHQVLSIVGDLADPDGELELTYHWARNGEVIEGASGASYTLTQADVGAEISAVVLTQDALAGLELLFLDAIGPVANVNDAPAGTLAVDGLARQGEVLTVSDALTDEDGVGTVSYQWLRNGVAVAGATTASYLLGQADVGATIAVVASYTDGFGAQEQVTSAATAPVQNVNDAPEGTATAQYQTWEDTALVVTSAQLLQGFGDADGDALVVRDLQLSQGSVVANGNGTWTLLPGANVNGALEMTYVVDDGNGSSVAASSVLEVSAVNDAPVLVAGAPAELPTLVEDATYLVAVSVASLLGGSATDVEGASAGIAISAVNAALGNYQFSVDGGASWETVRADLLNAADDTVLLLGQDALLRLTPLPDQNGTLADALTIRAWDQSSGSQGSYQLAGATGGSSAFSTATTTVGVTVAAVNDAPTFSIGTGKVFTDIQGGAPDYAFGSVVQADGKTIVVGASGGSLVAVRYTADGGLDASFASAGIFMLAGGHDGRGVALQQDGKILIADKASSGNFSLVRLNVDGTLDLSFGGTGYVQTDLGAGDEAYSLLVEADGQIVVGGTSSENFALARYNADGSLDTSGFGGGTGIVVTDVANFSREYGFAVAVQGDGKLVIGGMSSLTGDFSSYQFAVARYDASGALDPTFGGTGIVTTTVANFLDTVADIAVQADGKVVAVGFTNYRIGVVRYNEDGSLDTSFGGTGKVTSWFGGYNNPLAVELQSDGKILVAGETNSQFFLARYTSDGALDPTFGAGSGRVLTPVNDGVNGSARSISVQDDGKIVVAGISAGYWPDFAAVRYNADGSLDTTFGTAADSIGQPAFYSEAAAAIRLDGSVAVHDVELAALGAGAGNYEGAVITLERHGGASAEDVFSAQGSLSFSAGNAVLAGVVVGSVAQAPGRLEISFNANATQARVNEVLSSIGYANSSSTPPESVQVDWTFNDGNTGAQGSGGAGAVTSSTLVQITPNDAPVATAPAVSLRTTEEDTWTSGIVGNLFTQVFSDADGDSFAGVAITANATTPAQGTWQYSPDGIDTWITVPATLTDHGALVLEPGVTLRFIPALHFHGNAPSLTVRLIDDSRGAVATGTIVDVAAAGGSHAYSGALHVSQTFTPVNDAPVGSASAILPAGLEDNPYQVTEAVLLEGFADADGDSLNVNNIWVEGGTVTFNPDRSFIVQLAPNASGEAVLHYDVQDGTTSRAATQVITFLAVNDAPVSTVPGTQVLDEDTTTVFSAANGNAITVTDVDETLPLTTTLNVTGGTLVASAASGAIIVGNGTGTVRVIGTAAQVTAALDGLVYAPVADFNGAVTLTVETTDGTLVDFDTIALAVTPVSDIVADALGVTEDGAVTANVIAGGDGASADHFENAGAMVTSVTQGAHGAVTFTASGNVTYTPDANFFGTDSYSYTVTSGGVTETATVVVHVAAVNDAPVNGMPPLEIAQIHMEDTTRGFGLYRLDDVWVPNRFTVADVDNATLTTTISVPTGTIAVNGGVGATVTNNNTGTVTVQGTAAQINDALNGLGFRPVADFNGKVILTMSTSDGTLSDTDTVEITVLADRDIANDALTTAEDGSITANVITGTNGATADTFENPGRVISNVTQAANGSVAFTADGNVTYTPNANFHGVDAFTYTVSSGGVTETATVSVTVSAVNDAPVSGPVALAAAVEDMARVITHAELLAGASDVDGDSLSVLDVHVAAGGGSVVDNHDGTWTYTPAANAYGMVTIAYTVTDNGSTNGAGDPRSITVSATLPVTPVQDAPAGGITLRGTAREDEVLSIESTVEDGDGMGPVSYQWQRNGEAILDATGASYTLTQSDVGAAITVRASYVDGLGNPEQVTSAASAPVQNVNDAPVGVLAIHGVARQGQVLQTSLGLSDEDGVGALTFQWSRDGVVLAGETGGTYVLEEDDVGAVMTVAVSYTDGQGTVERIASAPTAPVENVNDAPTGAVLVSGEAREGAVLSASYGLADADGLGSVSFQWLRDGIAVEGATGATYLLGQADVGASFSVAASYVDGHGTTESVLSATTDTVANVNDAPTGGVTWSGAAVQHALLTASHTLQDEDGLGTVAFQWLRDGVAIADATSQTYRLSQEDVGRAVSVAARYTDAFGAAEEVVSSATGPVQNVNDAPSGGVAISGDARQNATLQASHDLLDPDGLGVLSFQWLRNGEAIAGATDSSYQLGQADVGKAIQVRAAYVDGFGAHEQVASSATGLVENVNDAPERIGTLPAQAAREDSAFTYKLPASGLFRDIDGDALTLSVQNLPSWLRYDAATSTLSGTPRDGAAGVVQVTVVAQDPSGATAQAMLQIAVADNPGLNWVGTKNADIRRGTAGQDSLAGEGGKDILDGGAGSDWLTGGGGNDTIATGTGWDTLVFSTGSGKDTVSDFRVGFDRLLLTDGVAITGITQVDTNKDGIRDATLVTFSNQDDVTLVGVLVATATQLLNPLP